MANRQPRIPIPRNVGEKIALAKKIFEKHQADGAPSPLSGLQDFNWDTVGPIMVQAHQLHEQAESLRRQAELAYSQRDLLLGDINSAIKSSRDVLKGVHRKNLKRLGEWGFTVDDSPRLKKTATGS